jgi:hypothetical protein
MSLLSQYETLYQSHTIVYMNFEPHNSLHEFRTKAHTPLSGRDYFPLSRLDLVLEAASDNNGNDVQRLLATSSHLSV